MISEYLGYFDRVFHVLNQKTPYPNPPARGNFPSLMGGSKGVRYIFISFVPETGIHEGSYQYIKQSLFVNEICREIVLPVKFVFDNIINHFNYGSGACSL